MTTSPLKSIRRWLVPEAGDEADERARARVRRQLIEQNAAMLRVVGGLSVPTILMFGGVLVACGSPVRATATWVVVAVVAATGPVWCATRPDPAARRHWVPMTAAVLATSGAAWGSFTLLALPPQDDRVAIVGAMVLGVLAANSVFGSSVPANFWAFQLAVAGSFTAGMVLHHPPATPLVLVIVLYAVPFSGGLGRINRTAQTNAAHYAATSERQRTAAEVANLELAHQANHDGLTGLLNRYAFTTLVADALARPGRRSHVGVLFIDLDRFKVINDSLGHAAGDVVLKEVAHRMGGTCRAGEVLGRMGGDELTMLLPDVASVEVALARADDVMGALAEPIEVDGRRVLVGASVGVSCSDAAGGSTAGDLLRRADAALYQAKAAGRGRAHGFDAALRDALDRRLDEENALRSALREGEIVAWFQPVVDVATLAVNGAEALARWQHPDGVRPAASFIDLAIENGLDVDVSRAIAADLLRLRERVEGRGLAANLGLNVPPSRLDLVGEMLAPLGRLDGIAIEITETGVIHDPAAAHAALQSLRDRGATVWLDDFGRGDSALALLVDLPLDGIKIDRGFTERMLTDPTTRSIVVAISRLAHELGLWVVAEGVETDEQLAFVRDLGIPWAQGYLLGRPRPAADMFDLLATDRDRAGTPAV